MSLAMLPISETRLWQRLMQLAEIGKTGRTGVCRLALSTEDSAAKAWILDWAQQRKFAIATDAIGNLFVTRPGAMAGAAPVVVGSHLDSEPTGGRFDGAYGVVAGMEILDALEEGRIETRHPVELVVWTNEEGGRFHPGCMGSRAYAAPDLLGAMLRSVDDDGISVAAELDRHRSTFPSLPERSLGEPFAAFLEAHIEQGPVLEQLDLPVAAVSGIQGRRVFTIDVPGRTGHAGTVPQRLRDDALMRALPFLRALYARAKDDPEIRITPGRLLIVPNSPSVIPGHVTLTVDIRHPDAAVLAVIPAWLSDLAHATSGDRPIEVNEIDRADPASFDQRLTGIAAEACRRITANAPVLVSGAMHDAYALAPFCPTTMIFVRCREGISHHEDEEASPSDLVLGAQALSACLLAAAQGFVS